MMMTKLLLPLAFLLTVPSCATVQSARDKLGDMPEDKYQSLVVKVKNAATIGGEKLGEALGDKRNLGLRVSIMLHMMIETDSITAADVVKEVVDKYGSELDLEPQHLEYVRDGAKLIDAAVGQIKLGLDGKLTDREKELVLSLLQGLITGLTL